MVLRVPAQTETDVAALAADLRGVIGQLIRRLRKETLFPLHQASVLGRLDRCGAQSVSDLAAAERVRPQSMAQTVGDLEGEGLVDRKPDPDDRRRALVTITAAAPSSRAPPPARAGSKPTAAPARVGWSRRSRRCPRPTSRRSSARWRSFAESPTPTSELTPLHRRAATQDRSIRCRWILARPIVSRGPRCRSWTVLNRLPSSVSPSS